MNRRGGLDYDDDRPDPPAGNLCSSCGAECEAELVGGERDAWGGPVYPAQWVSACCGAGIVTQEEYDAYEELE